MKSHYETIKDLNNYQGKTERRDDGKVITVAVGGVFVGAVGSMTYSGLRMAAAVSRR
jgi:hypothetical protein